jgi:hypothetical protein
LLAKMVAATRYWRRMCGKKVTIAAVFVEIVTRCIEQALRAGTVADGQTNTLERRLAHTVGAGTRLRL